jgi:hypothetical protein
MSHKVPSGTMVATLKRVARDPGRSHERRDGAVVEVQLPKSGPNLFKVFVFDPNGGTVNLKQDQIVISRTTATVDGAVVADQLAREANQDRRQGREPGRCTTLRNAPPMDLKS